MRTLISPSGKVEVKWPSLLGGRWEIIVGGCELLSGIRWPGTRRSGWLIWGLDASAKVWAKLPDLLLTEAEELRQLSRQAGKPWPDHKSLRLPEGPPTDAAFDFMKAQGWSERRG